LIIKGEKKHKDEVTYLHQGIGTRSFTKVITIADTIIVKGADIKDGILRIGLENVIPEHKKPRKIEIGNDLKEFKPQLLQEQQRHLDRSTYADNLAS
jgi:molecular chaperone IbpA